MNFLDIFNIVDCLQIFVKHKKQSVLFEESTYQFFLFIGLCLYNKYNT